MREILFRAKTIPNDKNEITGKVIKKPKWIYGYIDLGYMHDCNTPLINEENGNVAYVCQYDTIGQYTGLTDKNGKKIFEGDISKDKLVVTFIPKKSSFALTKKGWLYTHFFDEAIEVENGVASIEIIGNIHDNPELLKDGETN